MCNKSACWDSRPLIRNSGLSWPESLRWELYYLQWWSAQYPVPKGVTRGLGGYKDGLQPETLADGNWLVKQNQPVSKIETNSDTNLRSLYESWFRNALIISKSVILWWQAKKGINSELEGANARRVLNIPSKRSLYHMCSSHTSAHLQKKSTCFSSWTSPHSLLSQMLEPPCHLQDYTLKWCARNLNLLKFLKTCLSKSLYL